MPTIKIPCLQCKEKHVKCDEQRPACSRCQKKRLSCTRPSKTTVFRHDTAASFSKDQKWVNSAAKHFAIDGQAPASLDASSESPSSPHQRPREETTEVDTVASGLTPRSDNDGPVRKRRRSSGLPSVVELSPGSARIEHPSTPASFWDSAPAPAINSISPAPNLPQTSANVTLPPIWEGTLHKTAWDTPTPAPSDSYVDGFRSAESRKFPLKDPQEACLMKYYVEEIGHWLDLADEDRHFQLVVPVRARQHPHLLNAIFAVAARHLCRMPQYKTPQGILYLGQLLPRLDKHSAVEYTLKCIPALRSFHEAHDDDYRDSIIATAVILRQLEEIDDEDDRAQHPEGLQTLGPQSTHQQINFLPIIDSVLRSPPSQTLFGRRSLIRAAYWMALRQEIYHSFTREQAPQLILASDYWPNASNANKAVMHTVQVVRWRWGDGTDQEWKRLMKQQEHVEQDVLADFQPIFRKEPDKSRGEIFPTVWYASNVEVTSNQQAMMAKSVLLAENPALKTPSASRSSWRRVESDVRALIIELCGIALCPPASPPAILNAVFVIQMYGDFFTDPYERDALRLIVDKYRAIHAWPSQKLTEMFG